jgi:hypothetical protein
VRVMPCTRRGRIVAAEDWTADEQPARGIRWEVSLLWRLS